jgi:hypothetical protein
MPTRVIFRSVFAAKGSQPKERPASIRLPVRGVDELRFEARRGRMHADELAVAILQNVVTHDLFAAVIDR